MNISYEQIHAYLDNPTEQQREELRAIAKKELLDALSLIVNNINKLKAKGLEEALFYNPGRELEKVYRTKEITKAELEANPLKAAYEKYVLPITYGVVNLSYPAVLLAILADIPPLTYEKAEALAIKNAEKYIEKIQKETGSNIDQIARIMRDFIRHIHTLVYDAYHKKEYNALAQIIRTWQEETARIETFIKEPVTDKENDVYYKQLEDLENEYRKQSEAYDRNIDRREQARAILAGILKRLFPGNTELIRKEISIADKVNSFENYIFLPNNSIHQFIKQALNSPQKVAAIKKGIISTQKNMVTEDISITYNGQDGSIVTIELARTKELFKDRVRGGAKLYNFFLQKTNEQYRKEQTTFLLQELVDLGIYANKDSAYRGIRTITNKMINMYIEGLMIDYEGGKKKEKRNIKAALIAQRDISYTACAVSLPPIIRENTRYITILPDWNYRLSENGFMLLDYIYFLARQNAENIKKDHTFTISLEAVRVRLGLPTPERAGKDPKRLIIDPIEKAIEDIEDHRNGTDIKITPMYNPDYKNIHEYLKGYLQIQLDTKAEAYMFKIAKDKEKEIKQAEKRKEKARIIAQAKIEEKNKKQVKMPIK